VRQDRIRERRKPSFSQPNEAMGIHKENPKWRILKVSERKIHNSLRFLTQR
jgi:hypothetical protein